jgi:ornithine cyclodeaminase
MDQELLILDKEYVEAHLEMRPLVCLMEETLRQAESGACTQYIRTAIDLPNKNILGMMPAYFEDGYFGAKILSVYPFNSKEGYPSHQGAILLFEGKHGRMCAVVDAMSVTKLRTGAVSAVASRHLANPDSSCLALLGCGEQAVSHLSAMLTQFELERVHVWDLYPQKARSFADKQSDKYNIYIRAFKSVKEAVGDADIVCTLTPSQTAILEYEWLKEGVHINAVGACRPDARELAGEVVARARFFGDNEASVMQESGDFLIPLGEGRIGMSHFLGTVGQVMAGLARGRIAREDITVFESLGMAVEDIAVANYLCKVARESA